jgi:hypothetical protein
MYPYNTCIDASRSRDDKHRLLRAVSRMAPFGDKMSHALLPIESIAISFI